MGLVEQKGGAFEINPEQFLQRKLDFIAKINSSRELRSRILESLHLQSLAIRQDKALAAIVLGTSRKLFNQKFRNRVGWSVDLLRRKRIKYIIVTGQKDHEDGLTIDQAEEARELAIKEFFVRPRVIFKAGGNNTQENLITAVTTFEKMGIRNAPVFIVSENEHLIRTMTVANEVLKPRGIIAFPSPVGGLQMLDPDDARVKVELIKAFAYNHVLYGLKHPFTPSQIDYIKGKIIESVTSYEKSLRPFLMTKVDLPVPVTPYKGRYRVAKSQLPLAV